MILTDGGPDQKNTNVTTKAALLGLVVLLDLAAIVAFRNAPDCSWSNPVERIMSLLNLGLQHCGFARKPCASADIERQMKGLTSMKALCDAAENNNEVKREWLDSIRQCKEDISQSFSTLEQKSKKVTVQNNIVDKADILAFKKMLKKIQDMI